LPSRHRAEHYEKPVTRSSDDPLQKRLARADSRTGVAAASITPRTWAVQRSLTLLRVFLVASAAILLVGAITLSSVLSSRLKGQVVDDARSSLTQYVDGVLRPQLVQHDSVAVHPSSRGGWSTSFAGGRRS
jgi:hypothetical protein